MGARRSLQRHNASVPLSYLTDLARVGQYLRIPVHAGRAWRAVREDTAILDQLRRGLLPSLSRDEADDPHAVFRGDQEHFIPVARFEERVDLLRSRLNDPSSTERFVEPANTVAGASMEELTAKTFNGLRAKVLRACPVR